MTGNRDKNKGLVVEATLPGIFIPVLGVFFIVLKLTGVIDWSWWWVLTPIWGWFLFVLCVLAVVGMTLLGIMWTITAHVRKRKM